MFSKSGPLPPGLHTHARAHTHTRTHTSETGKKVTEIRKRRNSLWYKKIVYRMYEHDDSDYPALSSSH